MKPHLKKKGGIWWCLRDRTSKVQQHGAWSLDPYHAWKNWDDSRQIGENARRRVSDYQEMLKAKYEAPVEAPVEQPRRSLMRSLIKWLRGE